MAESEFYTGEINSIQAAEEFSTNNGFPSDFIDPSIKEDPIYGIKVGKAIWGRYTRDVYSESSNIQRYVENRKYSRGKQNTSQYMDTLGIQGDSSYANLDFTPLAITQKFVKILVNKITNRNDKAKAEAVDPQSRLKKSKVRDKFQANMMLKQFSENAEQVTGIPIIPKGDFIPANEDELKVHLELKQKPAVEIGTEKFLEDFFQAEEWDELGKKIARDIVDNNKFAYRMYFDENNFPRARWVDIVNMTHSYSDKSDHSNVKYFGEVIQMTLGELKKMDTKNIVPDSQWEKIAEKHSSRGVNQIWNNRGYENDVDGDYWYDSFLIDVFDFWYRSPDLYYHEKKPNKKGGFYMNKKSHSFYQNASQDAEKKKRFTSEEIEASYEGLWIIDTDFVLNYKRSENMIHGNDEKTEDRLIPPFFIYDLDKIETIGGKSITETIMPHADMFQVYRLKVLQFVAKSIPPGIAMNIDAMDNIMLDGSTKLTPMESLKLYTQTGNYLYNSRTEPGEPTPVKPFELLPNGLAPGTEQFLRLMYSEIDAIREITGINEAMDASSPDKKALVGVQELAIQSSNNATRDLDNAFMKAKQRMSDLYIRMLQMRAKYDDSGLDPFIDSVGFLAAKELEFVKDFPLSQMGIYIEVEPDAEERQWLNQAIMIGIEKGELSEEDGIEVKQINNTKQAVRVLRLRKKQQAEARMKESIILQQENAKTQQESAMVAAQAEQIKQQAIAEKEKVKIEAQSKADLILEEKKHMDKMAEIDKEGLIKSRHIEESAQNDLVNSELSKVSGGQPDTQVSAGNTSVTVNP
jgi:hypothetical protein